MQVKWRLTLRQSLPPPPSPHTQTLFPSPPLPYVVTFCIFLLFLCFNITLHVFLGIIIVAPKIDASVPTYALLLCGRLRIFEFPDDSFRDIDTMVRYHDMCCALKSWRGSTSAVEQRNAIYWRGREKELLTFPLVHSSLWKHSSPLSLSLCNQPVLHGEGARVQFRGNGL